MLHCADHVYMYCCTFSFHAFHLFFSGFLLSFLPHPHWSIPFFFFSPAISSLQLRARECSGWRPERYDHHGDVGASARGLRHDHRLVHRHLPEAAGPWPEQAGVQDRWRPGRGMKESHHICHQNRWKHHFTNMCTLTFDPLAAVHTCAFDL